MKLKLLYTDLQFETAINIDNYSNKEVYYNKLKQADNSCILTIPYNLTIQNFINMYSGKNIKAVITDGENVVLTGYIRKNYSFSKKQRNQDIELEIVSPSYLLDVNTEEFFALTNTSLGVAVNSLLAKAGFSSNVELNEEIGAFVLEEGTNVKETLTELLLEYGYCYDFDNEGNFIVYPLFNIPENSSITQVFDGTNCLEEIKVDKEEQDYDGVSVEWNSVELVSNKLIFADTTNGASGDDCSILLPAKSYLGEVDDATSYYIEYDCAEGEVVYVNDASLIIESTNNNGLTYSFENLGTKGELSIYNKSDSSIKITKINVYGDLYVNKSTNKTKTSGKKLEELTAGWIHDVSKAKEFAENYANYINYADFSVSVKSRTNFALGTFVKITDTGLGTIYGRIIHKTTKLSTKAIEYKIEAISEYEPATASNSSTKKSTLIANVLFGKDGKDGTNGVSIRNKGNWASDIAYVNNSSYIDVVYYSTNGCSYSCKKSHTSSSSILPTNTTYWQLVASKGATGAQGAQGVSIRNKGNWASDIAYVNNNSYIDVVYYSTNGCSYSCKKSHTSSSSILPTNTTYWQLVASKGATGATGAQGVRGAQYRGAYSSAPTSSLINGDWYLNTTDGYCYYYTSSSSKWTKITNYTDYRYTQAIDDMVNLSATLTSNTNLTASVNTWISNLVAGNALINKLQTKTISLQDSGLIKSSNYVSGESGFFVNSNGDCEFNSGRFRGGLGDIQTFFTWEKGQTGEKTYQFEVNEPVKLILYTYAQMSNFITRVLIADLIVYCAIEESDNEYSAPFINGTIYDERLIFTTYNGHILFKYNLEVNNYDIVKTIAIIQKLGDL